MPLHVFGHVDAHRGVFVVEEKLRERARQLRFSDAGRTHEDERADGAIRIFQSRAGTTHRIRHRGNRFFLSDDALLDRVFHVHELLHFRLEHLRYRHAGPLRHDLGDVFVGHFFFEHRAVFLHLLEFRAGGVDFALQLRKLSVTQFRGALQISFALRARRVFANLLELRLRVGDLCDDRLLALPLRFQSGDFFLQLGDFAFDFIESLLRYGIGFARQRLLLDLQLGHTTRQLVDLLRHRRQLDAQTRGRFVDEVDRLIGKESIGDVTMRQRRGRD